MDKYIREKDKDKKTQVWELERTVNITETEMLAPRHGKGDLRNLLENFFEQVMAEKSLELQIVSCCSIFSSLREVKSIHSLQIKTGSKIPDSINNLFSQTEQLEIMIF